MTYERQRRIIIILSVIITLIIIGLAHLSMLSAETLEPKGNNEKRSPSATTVMRWMMSPPEIVRVECEEILPEPAEKCRPFLFLDEGSLQDLLNNYPACLEEPPYSLNFDPLPEIELTKPLIIYGRTDEPLKIRGLKLKAAEDFPKGEAAVKVAGGLVLIEGLNARGFEKAAQLEDLSKHSIELGKINDRPINAGDIILCD